MVFIFIWFQFLTISFALSSELSFDVVIVRPVPGGSCILTASAHPPHLFLLPSALGTGSLLHPSFLFSRQALSPAAAELGILLWQPVSPFCPNPSFKNSPHPRDLSRMKMVSYRQQVTDWKTTMYFRPPSSYALFSPGDSWYGYSFQSSVQQKREMTAMYMYNSKGLVKQIHLW